MRSAIKLFGLAAADALAIAGCGRAVAVTYTAKPAGAALSVLLQVRKATRS
jgi:hypothetical protein